MKKLLSLVLALALSLSMVACSDGGDSDGGKSSKGDSESTKEVKIDEKKIEKASGEEAAKETVVGFMDALCEFDLEELAGYTDADADEIEELPFKNFDELRDMAMREMADSSGMPGMEDYMKPVVDIIFDAFLGSMSYEIDAVKPDGDNYVITVDFECMDFDALDDEEALLGNEDFETAGMDLIMELYENGEITEDMTEEELMEALMPSVVEYMGGLIEENIAKIPPVSSSLEFVVYDDGGEWVISSDESDLSKFEEMMDIE